jgi:hypothetical protein
MTGIRTKIRPSAEGTPRQDLLDRAEAVVRHTGGTLPPAEGAN